MSRIYLKLLRLLLAALLGAALCHASVGGSISGTVRDASGGIVPKVHVTITNVNTGVSQVVTSSDLGVYSFLALPVGTYKLVVTKQGFQTYQRSGITLNTNDQLRYDVVLSLGQVTQEVQVTTSAIHVETVNTQLGDVVKSRAMESLPLNGRDFTDLLGLQPGVVPALATSQGNFFGSTEQGNVSISGQRETANGFLIDGASVNDSLNSGTTVIPNLDSIDEFRVLTANFDAEYGNYSGGIITVVTKSGSNQFHGDALEFLRNDIFDSRNFYEYNQVNPLTNQEISGTARGAFKRNQFGGTIGGPIRRDRAFFFADYQGTRERQGLPTGLVLVPSVAERNGDFSAIASTGLAGAVNGPYFATLLSQKLGYGVTSGEPYYKAGCASTMDCVFPGGIIPQAVFSSPSQKLTQYIPLPTEGPYFVSSANTQQTRDDRGAMRVDGNSRHFGMLSAYYLMDDNSIVTPFGTNNVPGFPTADGGRAQLAVLGDTKAFGATSLNEFRLSFNRHVVHNSKPGCCTGIPLSQFGFEENKPGGITTAAGQFEGAPSIGFNTFSIGLPGVNYNRYENTPSALDNFSKVVGKHTIKFGGQYIFNDFYEPMPLVGGNGFISFTGSETGTDFADYLIGAPSSFIQEGGFWIDNRRNYVGAYAQDSWRAMPELTLNYGLRWDIIQPWYEKSNQLSTYVPGVTSNIYPGAPVGYVFPGDKVPGFGTIPRTIARTPLDKFAPRLGFAYSPSANGGMLAKLTGQPGNFSVRGGFGLFYTNVEGVEQLDESGLPPFDDFYVSPAPPLFAAPYTNRTDGAIHPSPFPFTIPRPGGTTSAFWTPFVPISGSTPEINQGLPYSENWNLTMQRQFGNSTLFSIGYVGSAGHHLLAQFENNPGNQQLCLSLSQAIDVVPGTPTCGPFGENGVYTRPDGTIVNSTRGPLGPNFAESGLFATLSNSIYHSLQISLRHTTHRMMFFASYTFSKSIDNTSTAGEGPNPLNPKLSRALSGFDMTHDFVVSYAYLLPFDHLAGGRLPRLTSGWRLVGITRFATGFPVTLTESDDRSLIGDFSFGVNTPNFSGGNLHFADPRSGKPYFNTSLFSPDRLGYFGTANRRFFHGPGFNNWDLSLQKDLRLTESKSLQFRAEFFNAFNHAQFTNPNGNIDANFGMVTNANSPRIGQIALKLIF